MNPYEAVCIEVLTVRVAARRSKEVRKTPGGRRFLARGGRKEAGGEGLGAMSKPSLSTSTRSEIEGSCYVPCYITSKKFFRNMVEYIYVL